MALSGDTDESRSVAQPRLGVRSVLLVLLTVTIVHTFSPSVQIGDSRLSVPVANQVLRHGSLDLSSATQVTSLSNKYDVTKRGARVLPYYPWPPMLFAVPGALAFAAAGKDAATLRPSDPNQTWKIEIPTASLLVALTAVVLALVAFDMAGGPIARRRRLALATALIFAFATGAWSTGSRALWQHTPSMLFLALALLCALRIERGNRWSVALGAALGAGFAMRPSDAVAVVCLLAWLAATHRRALTRALGGMALVIVPFVAVNVATYGSIIPPYYSATRIHTGATQATVGFFDAAAMYLVSPSRGMLFYDPILLVAIAGVVVKVRRGSFTRLDLALGVVVVGQWVVISTYGSAGGSSYGPRLMTDVLPYIVYLAIPALEAVFGAGLRVGLKSHFAVASVLLVILGWSVVANASGALLRSAYCWSATPTQIDTKPSRVWDWSDPQFLRPLQRLDNGASLHEVVLGSCHAA